MWVGAKSGIAIAQYLVVNLMVGFSEGDSVFVFFNEFQFFNDDVMSYQVPIFKEFSSFLSVFVFVRFIGFIAIHHVCQCCDATIFDRPDCFAV